MSAPPPNVRALLLRRLEADLVGPKDGPDETIDERPSARYLTGILYPQQSEFSEEEDDSLDAENGGGSNGEEDEQREATSLFRSFKPATCGFSFSVEIVEGADLRLTVRFGRYAGSEIETEGGGRPRLAWTRTPHEHADLPVSLEAGIVETRLEQGLILHRRVRRDGTRATVTLQFVNEYREAKTSGGTDPLVVTDMMGREAAGFYQFEASVECRAGCAFVPRRRSFRGNDEDGRIADLIYRDSAEYAVGHTASAQWQPVDCPTVVRLDWFPTTMVKRMDADGDPLLSSAIAASPLGGLHGLSLHAAAKPDLIATLASVADGYDAWIAAERVRSPELPVSLAPQARRNLERCERALSRMREGIALIEADPQVETAFRLANRAM